MRKNYTILLILFLLNVVICRAQKDSLSFKPKYRHGIQYTIRTTVGTSYTGFVILETKDYITLENRLNHESWEIKKNSILEKETIIGSGKFSNVPIGENPHARSYLFSGSAFLFEAKKATTNSYWLLLEDIEYALSDNWAIALNTLAFYPFTLGVKCSYQLNELDYIGGSVFGIANVASSGPSSPLLGYGALARFTRGTSNKNITISGGVIGINSDFFAGVRTAPFVNLGFVSAAYCNRFNKRTAFTMEGWYLPEARTGLGGFGFKFVGDAVTCWTVGCYTVINRSDNTIRLNLKTIPIPYFGVSKRFG